MKILLFESVHRVMQAEGILIREGVPCEMLPTPKEHSAECGMCLGVAEADLERALAALDRISHRVVDRE